MEEKKDLALYALTPTGGKLALRLAEAFPQAEVFLHEKIAADCHQEGGSLPISSFPAEGLSKLLARNFHLFRSHVFIMATAIAVRTIAPHLTDKWHDPAVVVVDEKGRWAISLLGGHWGGAHELARDIARKIKAQPVITTATDISGKTAIEVWARKQGLCLENVSKVKAFNAALVREIPIFCWSEYQKYLTRLPEGVIAWDGRGPLAGDFLIIISDRTDFPRWPAQHLLLLRPPTLFLGLGCNRGTSKEEIHSQVRDILAEHGYSILSLAEVGTIDRKADEPGLLAFARRLGLKISFFNQEELNRLDPPSPPSEYVKNILGVKGVSECAAMLLSGEQNLVIPKTKRGNVALALARKKPED
ncbi:MAG: cobalt-precorrin 5A hydrolase [bacterium]|nr:cobalt-precorrin 5A hydrolase [bacterium]